MKKILFVMVLLFAQVAMFAQTNNFYVENGKIYWQRVYEQDVDIEAMLINSGKFIDISTANNIISATLKPGKVDTKGRSVMDTPIYIRDGHVTGFVRIQQKEGKYRVTVDQIIFIDMVDSPLGQQGEETALEVYAVKRDGSIRPYFLNTASSIINEAFIDLFMPAADLGDDW